MAHTNDKTKEEKLLEALLSEYGASGNVVVNEETGEISIIPNGSKIVYPKIRPKDKSGRTLEKFKAGDKFVKLYKKSIEYLRNNYSYKEGFLFIDMAQFARMNDCVLVNDNGEYLSVKDLSTLFNIDYTNFRKTVSKFEKEGLIKRIEVPSQKDAYKTVTGIAINPYLCMNGEYVVVEVLNQFKDLLT